jgi:hypothetical protein
MSSFYTIQLNEIIEIDRQVTNNREAAYLFVRNSFEFRGKAKDFFVYGMFISAWPTISSTQML